MAVQAAPVRAKPIGPQPRHRRMSIQRREALTGYGFVSIWIIGFIIFTLGPMVVSLFLSFTDYNIVTQPEWVGLDNYRKLFNDPLFWQSLKVTITYALVALPLSLLLGLALAVLLNQKIPFQRVWRTVYFLPSVIAGVAVALLWLRIFNPRYGLVNAFLALFGIEGPGWLNDPYWALPALMIMGLWGIGGGMIIYLAGLQGIPTDLYDAAKVDGASTRQRFRYVTLPMLSPVIFYNLVLGLIGTFQYFTEVYVTTGGGPARATLFYNLYLYQNAFKFFDMGYASAMAWVLFLIVFGLTMLVFRSSAMWVYYEGELRK